MDYNKITKLIMSVILASADGEISIAEMAKLITDIMDVLNIKLNIKIPEHLKTECLKILP